MATLKSLRHRIAVASDPMCMNSGVVEVLRKAEDLEVINLGADPFAILESRTQSQDSGLELLIFEAGPSRMDTLLVMKRLLASSSLPILVIALGADVGSNRCIELFNAGAIDVLPSVLPLEGPARDAWVDRLLASVRALGRAQGSKPATTPRNLSPLALTLPRSRVGATLSFLSAPPPRKRLPTSVHFHPKQLILIGASTGGTEAIRDLLKLLPAELPGICIVQHIPAAFSKSFADRLNAQCAMEVREAVMGDVVRQGLVLVAPGGKHMELRWRASANCYEIVLHDGPAEHHQRPAVDVLFRSAASAAGCHALGVLLTGMGKDGALGMKALKSAGAYNLAQDEKSCVVFGMPGAANELGVVDQLLPIDAIAQTILGRLHRAKAA